VSEARTYTVEPGDNVASIAQANNLTVAELARLNQLEGSAELRPGTLLILDDTSVQPIDPVQAAAARKRAAEAEAALVPTEPGTDIAMWSASVDGQPTQRTGALRRLAEGIVHRTSAIAMSLTHSAMRFVGVPYSFGGTTARGFDCSGYVQHVFAMLGVHLPRTADAQYIVGQKVAQVEPGDLVFFQTYSPGASHVGIYLGKGNFVHSSSSRGVTVSALRESYWSARYLGAKRILAGH
jgi:cell wall-associated NlpC family hydrolase